MAEYTLLREISDMIEKAAIPGEAKMLARECLRKLADISNGHKGSVEAVSDTVLALSPLIMSMFLNTPSTIREVAKEAVADAMEQHVDDCPFAGQIIQKMDRRTDGDAPFNWKRFAFEAGSKMGWPSAVVAIAVTYRDLIFSIFGSVP